MARPILRPMPCLRAQARMTASLTGKTVPARSRASRVWNHGSSLLRGACLGFPEKASVNILVMPTPGMDTKTCRSTLMTSLPRGPASSARAGGRQRRAR
jgi:hypothetical protein